MSSTRLAAEAILDELEITEPALLKHLVEICIERGAYVRQAPLVGADARLTVNGSHGLITVKPQPQYKSRVRFSIAHELGHFEMHRRQKMELSCAQKDIFDSAIADYWAEKARSRESEANSFASELLMPARFIRPVVVQNQLDMELIQKTAQEYQTSFFATLKRFVQLTPQDCIAAFYTKDKVQSFHPSPSLSESTFPLARKLREGSLAFRASHGKRISKGWESVAASDWFQVSAEAASESEQQWRECSRFFPKLGIGVSLLVAG